MPLTDQQRTAIKGKRPNNLLLAGPGTGKSFTILGYIETLLSEGVTPNNILVVTFTRAATYELRREICRLLGENAVLPHIHTLHAFSLRQLMLNVNRVDHLPHNFSIADDFEERHIILEDLKRQLGIVNIRDVKRLFNLLASNWETLNADRTDWEVTFESPEFVGAWREHREIFGYILRSELVYQFKKALEEVDELRLDGPLEYVIVDEYQDLNRCDLRVIRCLNENGARLFAAGDDDQSIYGFRYAYPEGIRRFTEFIPDSEQHSITECHRCDEQILRIAMEVIRQDHRRVPKILQSVTGEPGNVSILRFPDQIFEASKIAEIIQVLKERKGYDDKDFLVLLRTDFRGVFSEVISQSLQKLGISVNIQNQRHAFLDTPIVRRFIAIAKYLDNIHNDLAVRTILSTTLGIGPTLIDSLITISRNRNWRFHQSVQAVCNGEIQGIRNSTRLQTAMEPISILKRRLDNEEMEFSNIVDAILEILQADRSIGDILKTIFIDQKIESIKELISFITDILGPAEPSDEYVEGVRIMSMHRAKGLTSKVVFVVAAEDEYMPGRGEPDEERRLFYVSLTRAKHYLYVTYCTRRTGQQRRTGFLRQSTSTRTLTRFLTDIPEPRPVNGCTFRA
jgi:DNA helicase-2/ATP-dependent DNA helicase PcrA